MDKIKIFFKNKWVIAGILLIVFLFIGFTAGSYYPKGDAVARLVNKQIAAERDRYDKIILEKDAALKDTDKKLSATIENYNILQKELAKLKGAKQNVKPPQNVKELVTRYNALGYTPKQ